MKNKIILIILGLFLISISSTYYFYNENKKNLQNYSISENNFKASQRMNLSYELTLDQLKSSKDSSDIKLMAYAKALGIKNSKVKAIMIIKDTVNKIDTVRMKDTTFVKDLKIDTVIGDKWIQKKLHLEYPNIIIIDEDICNEKMIVWSNKKETIKPPSKFFLFRLFQKKQIVVEINIKDMNPYFKTNEFKYINVIK